MRSEYVYQSLDQPTEVVTPRCGSLGIFGVRLFVDKDDIEIRVVAELPTAEFAVGNDAQLSIRLRRFRCLECTPGNSQCLTQQCFSQSAE